MLDILDKKITNEKQLPAVTQLPPGLTDEEAERRFRINGPNRLAEKKKKSAAGIFAGQFKDFMVMILLAATVISVLLGEIYDALAIITIVLLNAILGFIQEFRTEHTLEALEKMTAPTAKVWRNGVLKVISAEKVAEGDLFEVEAGDRIPCDGMIISCKNFSCDESILTGETVPADKRRRINENDFDSLNLEHMAYMGTIAVKGTARCVCTATGLRTQMGRVSGMLEDIGEEQTPLQKKLGELGKALGLICIAVCIIVSVAGILRGEPVFQMLMTGITVAIAAIPEGLPAAVTIALALAVRRMLKQNALVHRLHSVETLGCATVICTDKTGTITENKMTVCKAFTADKEYTFSGSGHKRSGDITSGGHKMIPEENPCLTRLLTCGALCSNAVISSNTENSRNRARNNEWSAVGDPTEAALLIAAAKADIYVENLGFRRLDEIPFESETRMMTVIGSDSSGRRVSYIKGAVDAVLKDCDCILTPGGNSPLTLRARKLILKANDNYAAQALRVLAFAEKRDGKTIFLGLEAMEDPLRPEAKKAIKMCSSAHIKTVMITGDHKLTACAVARQAGILKKDGEAMTGAELEKLSDEELDRRINGISVFARVTPDHKLRIVRSFKRLGNVVAMTGDGVNDAPAIKEASIGVSMGITGTDVTKQAADVILLDDNFSTLVNAVEQGRNIYSNIRKFVRYLISCNIGEVVTMFLSIIMGLPVVLLPTQILLVNLATDGLPAIALGLEPPEEKIMSAPPRKDGDSFFSGGLLSRIIFRGILIGLFTIASFVLSLRAGWGLDTSRTCALFTLVVSQLVHVFECKSENKSLFSVPYLNNLFLIFSVVISAVCLLAAIYLPFMQMVFSTLPLNFPQLLLSMGAACAVPVMAALFSKSK